jgi:hypothetical protein
MNLDFANAFIDDWLDSWNSHDLDRIISHYEEALEFKSPLIVERYNDPTGTISSREKLREYFQIGLTKNPQLRFELVDVMLGVNELIIYYKNARGGRTSELFEFNDKGKVVKSVSCYS